MGKMTVVLGSAWGDEGKGKIVHFLSKEADIIIRATGGNNAGHTVVVNGAKYALHLIPSGLIAGKLSVICNGVVINPNVLLKEMDELSNRGIDISNLRISDRANLILPYNVALDKLQEKLRGKNAIGTTLTGNGPTYQDKAKRTSSVRVQDLFSGKYKNIIESNVEAANFLLAKNGMEPIDYRDIIEGCDIFADRIGNYSIDSVSFLHNQLNSGKNFLCEGAQAALLDVDLGTHPDVTSSNTTIGGVLTGSGLSHLDVGDVYGVLKGYSTRVGNGSFPTEQDNEIGNRIRELGHEYGTTTGRPRRCGWLDLVALKYACRVNGFNYLALNHLDTIGHFDKICVCVGYEYENMYLEDFPSNAEILKNCHPVYETLDGAFGDISGVRDFEDLPLNAKRYIDYIENYTGVVIKMIGVGPSDEQTIVRNIKSFVHTR
ncbi:MAG: adenylosuccinate synthase [Bacilli bacterium]|nr:adenylosuccinate synthase [Bacilli bacterium]